MHPTYSKSNFPYYGQPYHTYYPPAYPHQQQQHHQFPTSDPYPPPRPQTWSRDGYAATPYPQSQAELNPPFVPPSSGPPPPAPRPKRANTTRPAVSRNPEKAHLRSAMKKNAGLHRSETVTSALPPLERTRTSSSARQRLVPMTRTGTNSNPNYVPGQ